MNNLDNLNNLIKTGEKGEIRETLDFLLNECSLDEMPSSEQVLEWQEILSKRGTKFQALAQMCQDFLQEIQEI